MAFTIAPENFYGPPSLSELKINKLLKAKPLTKTKILPSYLNSLRGPLRTWKTFGKQQDAILLAERKGGDLMVFAFEHGAGIRSFLVCHPIMLWFISTQRSPDKRCTYEIIREECICKLYLDIEFEYLYNKLADGNRMLETALKIICLNLKVCFGVQCSRGDILDLDSSTEGKFSRHIIFELQNCAFENNYACGNFIKGICQELEDAAKDNELMHQVSSKYDVSKRDIKELLVCDRKGLYKPFIDRSVYTKNRHFRLLGSTKLHKNAPLRISKTNLFQPKSNEEYSYFLTSLVTFFDRKVDKVLSYGPSIKRNTSSNVGDSKCFMLNEPKVKLTASRLDQFVQQIILPRGRIRKRIVSENEVTFEIVGFRYCGNIKREHRSNNIKLVLDLKRYVYYQTCFDPDCKGYRSECIDLPAELQFLPEDEPFFHEIADNLITDDDLQEMLETNNNSSFFNDNNAGFFENFCEDDDVALLNVSLDGSNSQTKEENSRSWSESFCDNDLTDSDLIGVADAVDMVELIEDTCF